MHDHVQEVEESGGELEPGVPGCPDGLLVAVRVVQGPGGALFGTPAGADHEVEEGYHAESAQDKVYDHQKAGAETGDLVRRVGEGDHFGHGEEDTADDLGTKYVSSE